MHSIGSSNMRTAKGYLPKSNISILSQPHTALDAAKLYVCSQKFT